MVTGACGVTMVTGARGVAMVTAGVVALATLAATRVAIEGAGDLATRQGSTDESGR